MTENTNTDKNVVVSSKNKTSIDRQRFMEDRNISTYMKCEYRRASPGRVGVSLFLEAEIDGERFRGGKTKSVKSEHVVKIRESLDVLGSNFNNMALENTSDASFDDLISGIFERVVKQDED